MTNPDNYITTVLIDEQEGWREIYSSQNYSTFYVVYMSFQASVNPSDPDKIDLRNIIFKLINYKGTINLGLKSVEFISPEESENDDSLIVSIKVQGLNSTRFFPKGDISISKSRISNLLVNRELVMVDNFCPESSSNEGQIFDDEFYYRDSELKPDERTLRPGMDGYEFNPNLILKNGSRCWQQNNKIIYG